MRYPTARQLRGALARTVPLEQAKPVRIEVLPAPVGGLNGRDAWSDMDQKDAIQLDNWFPGFGKCEVRPGSALHATVGSSSNGDFTASSSAVETLAEFHGADTRKLLAAAGDSIYDVSAAGEQDTALVSSLNNARWQVANMNDLLLMVNGEDDPLEYDGSSISTMSISGSGLDVKTLIHVHVFKGRAYYIPVNSQSFWHTEVNAHAGTLTEFPLGDVGSFGGHLMAMTTYSREGGEGQDALAVFIMSSGEVIVYAGSDPSDAADWALVGIFEIGAPLGRRCVTKVGGDALIATVDGPVLLSRVLPGGRMASGMRVTDKLGSLLADQAALTGSSFGWQFFYFPQGQRAWLNYPSGGEFEQFAVNLRTGAWCRFRGMNSSCWALFNDRPYFGATNGRVVEANTGTRDLDAEVVAEALQAPSYLRRPRVNKQITMVSPLLEAAAAIPLRVGLAANFAPRPQTTADTTIGVAGGVSTPWGSPWGSPWSTPSKTVEAWIGHSARGVAIAPYVRIEQSDKRVAWNNTRVGFIEAGPI